LVCISYYIAQQRKVQYSRIKKNHSRNSRYFDQLDCDSVSFAFSSLVSTYTEMGKKSKPGRSFFSNLPLDLRSSLRSQTLLPLVPGQNINTLETKQEELDKALGLGAGNDYLPTQPASPSSSDEDEVYPTPVAPLVMPIPEVVAESSTSAKKRALLSENETDVEMSNQSMITNGGGEGKKQKVEIKKKSKGKGKAKAVEDGNRFKGHRWDCTGLVTRYTKPTEMPSELVKCESYFAADGLLSPTSSDMAWVTDVHEWWLTSRLVSTTIPTSRV